MDPQFMEASKPPQEDLEGQGTELRLEAFQPAM